MENERVKNRKKKQKNCVGILKKGGHLYIGYRKVFKIIFDIESFNFLSKLKNEGFEKEI